MRRAFTLIELLVIIGIMGAMVTMSVLSVRSGQGAARVRGAARDVFAAIRHARSTALVTGQPAVITYSTEEIDGESVAKVEIASAKLFDEGIDMSKVQTLTGEPLKGEGFELVHIEKAKKADKDGGDKTPGGEKIPGEGEDGSTVTEILFAPVDTEVVKGMRIKVAMGDEETAGSEPKRANKISVFSNVDYLLGKFKEARAAAAASTSAGAGESQNPDGKKDGTADTEKQEPVSVVWETNGRVEPHQVWVYEDGKSPESGLLVKIDRFGAAKVLSGDGKDDDD